MTRSLAMMLAAVFVSAAADAAQSTNNDAARTGAAAHSLHVVIDPRVELMSLIFRMAGNPEYNMARVDSYAADADKQFAAFRDHSVVKIARQLRAEHGVSYDAVMGMAMHVTDTDGLKLRLPLDPWPESLDRRWTAQDATNFLDAARLFAKESQFQKFIEQHTELYQTAVERMEQLLDKEAHLEWFDGYFGPRSANFTVTLGLLNGGGCYGPHFRSPDGREELHCILGVWKTDAQGMPIFDHDAMATVIHEFCHSYANPLVERHLHELRPSGDALYRRVAQRMRAQAYGSGETLLCESMVRVCVIRYQRQYDGEAAARRAIEQERKNGFLWMPELSDLLGDYEKQRDKYPTLEEFAPRLAAFFADAAKNIDTKVTESDAGQPKIVSMIPENGAQDVDPEVKSIQVIFDRPMTDKSWSLVGGGEHFPNVGDGAHYDAERKIWTVPVELKPDWQYEFMLNSGTYTAFRSADGVPLEPVEVSFKTAPAKK